MKESSSSAMSLFDWICLWRFSTLNSSHSLICNRASRRMLYTQWGHHGNAGLTLSHTAVLSLSLNSGIPKLNSSGTHSDAIFLSTGDMVSDSSSELSERDISSASVPFWTVVSVGSSVWDWPIPSSRRSSRKLEISAFLVLSPTVFLTACRGVRGFKAGAPLLSRRI